MSVKKHTLRDITATLLNQPRSQGSLLPALWSSAGRVGENLRKEVVIEFGCARLRNLPYVQVYATPRSQNNA